MRFLTKQVCLCTIGTMLEWYDFSLFASLAPIISEIFFPRSNQFAAMMLIFVVFASGFIMRPIGAIFFGHLGDKIGRKSTLLITISIMTIATVGIGLIPTITILSTALLVICRLAQGFAASGEYPGGIVLLAEQQNQSHKTFISSFGIFAAVIGIFFGTFACTLVSKMLRNIFSILIGMFVGPLSAMSAEYFPIEIRYTGVGVALNFAAAIFGGTAPLVCAWLAKITNNPLTPSYYVILSAGVALMAVMTAVSRKSTYREITNSV